MDCCADAFALRFVKGETNPITTESPAFMPVLSMETYTNSATILRTFFTSQNL
jgi:hypothetical protein